MGDTVVLLAASLAALYLRYVALPHPIGTVSAGTATLYAAVVVGSWSICLAVAGVRRSKTVATGIEEYRRVVAASFWAFCATALAEMVFSIDIPRGFLASMFALGVVGLLLNRWLLRTFIARARCAGKCRTAVLAVGSRGAAEDLARELTRNPRDGHQVVAIGVLDRKSAYGEQAVVNGTTIPIVNVGSNILDVVGEYGADTVALAGTERFGATGLQRLIWKLEPLGVDLVVSPGVLDVACSRLMVRPIAGLRLLHIAMPLYRGTQRFGKQAFDFCFALAAVIATSPMLLLAAIAIKLDSEGPVFYRAERIGLRGRPFQMLKLRTMVVDAEQRLPELLAANEHDGILFKIRNDPRVTRVGRVLRRYSIDELPQFLNVLARDMSVVGPRPPLAREVEQYDDDIWRRLLIKPGITGMWQVSGRSDLSWKEAVRMDLAYVDNWSMAGDLVIIAKTLSAVTERRGAY